MAIQAFLISLANTGPFPGGQRRANLIERGVQFLKDASFKIKVLMMEQICRGATARGLAQAVATAVICGGFPLFGLTTLMCLFAGAIFKLNHPTLQIVNYAMAPAQLLLMPVCLRVGEFLLGAPPTHFAPAGMLKHLLSHPLNFMVVYAKAGAMAVLGWGIVLPVIGVVVFCCVYPALRRLSRRAVCPA